MAVEYSKQIKVDSNTQMRDAVIERLYDLSETDKDIMFFTADMGAKALDLWRENKTSQYRDVGIAEQGMASIAAGMAKEGKRVFIYAIAPFVTSRIHEFHKVNAGIQNIPYNTVGVGTGFSYPDSGPTHYNTEDISIMNAVPNMEILSPSDSIMAAEMAEQAAYSDNPTYLRLERYVMPLINNQNDDLKRGFNILKEGETYIVSTGNMVHRALEVSEKLRTEGKELGVIDLYRIKPLNNEELTEVVNNSSGIITLEEHLLNGGIGSIVSTLITDNRLRTPLERIGIDDRLFYLYGRDNIQRQLGLDVDSVTKRAEDFFKVSY